MTNNLTTALPISAVNFTGPFALSTVPGSSTCPVPSGSLASGASCVYAVTFTPTVAGPVSGSISIFNADSPAASATLGGTGTLATSLSSASLAFGNVVVNMTSTSQIVTLSNLQLVPLHFTSITVPAPYSIVSGAGACAVATAVPANGSCTITVTLKPTANGVVSASAISIVHDVATSPDSFTLTGTGVTPITISPSPVAFGQVITLAPYTQTVTVTKNMATQQNFTGGGLTDAGYSVPSVTNTCNHPLAAGASCSFVVNLTAPTRGSYPGTISFVDNAPGSPQLLTLSATAVPAVVVSPTSLTFPAQLQGTTSAAQSITLTNNQPIQLLITSEVNGGANPTDFGIGGSGPTAPSTVPALGSCTITVTFAPITTGTRTATLTVSDDAPTSPTQTISLTGAGNSPLTITPPTALNYTAPVGSSSTFVQFTVTNTNAGAPVHISNFQTTGDFSVSATSCPIAPAPLANAASCIVTVNFVPTIAGTRGGQLLIYDDTVTSPQDVNLQGVGTNPLTL